MTARARPPLGAQRPVALVAAALAAAVAMPASAGPSVWTRAREPKVTLQDDLIRDAQRAFVQYRKRIAGAGPQAAQLAPMLLQGPKASLAKVVQAGTVDFGVRLLYADVLRESRENEEALKVLTKLLAERPPDPIRADALGDVAILHALAGRRDQEVLAYTQALEIEPHGLARSQLLANRAEAMMALGDVIAAVEGYRAALAPLTTVEMFWRGSTTLFSLGVALDRSGNPEAGMEAIRLARSYDATDKAFRRGSWFFSPAYDEHWYWALGSWTCGRSGSSGAIRAECYDRAVDEWELYIQLAPESDPWVSLARVRLGVVRREREEMKRAFSAQKKAPPAAPDSPTKKGSPRPQGGSIR